MIKMYKCFKFFKKIFLIFKNKIFSKKMEGMLNKNSKNFIIKYIKFLYFYKKNNTEDLDNLKKYKNYLMFKIRHFFKTRYKN